MPTKNAAAVRHIAPKRTAPKGPPVPFSLGFLRDDVEEPHQFTAQVKLSYGDIAGMVKGQKGGTEAIRYMDRLIRHCLLNNDGTPLKWQPEVVDGKFTAPDGETVEPASEAGKYLAFQAGSSRRRWVYLMEEDDDVEVEIEQITEVLEMLTEKDADRPT